MQSTNQRPGFLPVLLAILALALAVSPAQAQITSSWASAADGDFNTGGNWDIGVPGSGTNAMFAFDSASYTVTWSASATNSWMVLTGANHNVTFDLGGYTNVVNAKLGGYGGPWIFIGTGTTDSVSLTISNGMLRSTPVNSGGRMGTGSSLILTNQGKIYASGFDWDGSVLVSGVGSYLHEQDRGGGFGSLTINDGAAVSLRNVGTTLDITIDAATLTNIGGSYLNYNSGGDTIRVQNGGLIYGTSTILFGLNQNSFDKRVIIGNDGPLSMMTEAGIRHEESYNASRGNVDVIVSTNGVVQLRGGYGISMYSSAAGPIDWKLQDNGMITLRGGAIAMNTNTTIGITDNNPTNSIPDAGTAILRGYGTISNYNAGANFQVLNHGTIRPGDYGYEVGTHSNIVAIGTINIIGGDLIMTNPLSEVGSAIHFDFSETGFDQIAISGGSATITGGSNIFTLAAGSSTPGPFKWGLGTYDFITGTNVVWAPEYANLTNILAAAGLTEGLEYSFGIRYIEGGLMALRLEFIPEPSTIMLLLGGGFLVFWSRRRKI